ncbi:MerR family transcriptional regulator [Bradyrhizobium sp. S69]|uniref:MerR family transcriptional regulator n=1 Tax=Bradyrhizobium sp. S69 TaxID=1641856 RepID=UPI00131B54B1|nr:MerR family transcriptional regulator [Bradyrhizobium sp. S69]
MDKAPDAFRTISEVADDLDIPQHVLRFWETRFTQIKPMKRSGGRRYYRPDDVDLLKGIRRLLYGEGYTIRGVQRILKEHGIKSVQGLVDGSSSTPSFAPIDEPALRGHSDHQESEPEIDASETEDIEDDEITEAPADVRRAPEFAPAVRRPDPAVLSPARPVAAVRAENGAAARKLDIDKLKVALDDLIACRQLLDQALQEG